MRTTMTARMALGASVALLGLMIAPALTASAASAAPAGHRVTYTCKGGDIAPGTYGSVIITGVCYMPAGNVVITGDLTIARGALLDAVTPGDPVKKGKHVVPATVDVGGDVTVGTGAVLLFGCSPNITCASPPGISFDRIGGSISAVGAQGVVVHNATIGGSVSVLGGGGGKAAKTCAAQAPKKPVIAALKPWSEDPGFDETPVYSDFEDNSIGGSLTIAGLTSCWLGSLRNQIGGSASFTGNTMGDPDAMEFATNLVRGSVACSANTPAVQFGDSGAAPNLVGVVASGQCGFGVILPNPAPEAHMGKGVPVHISVSTASLGTFSGTRAGKTTAGLPPVKTEAGDMIFGDFNNVVFTGAGLTTTCKYNPKLPPGQSGEVVLGTTYPSGFSSYEAIENCKFRFMGKTGTAMIRAYGTVTPKGVNSGTFLVVSSGAGHGGLSTLAGWGTYSSKGEPVGSLRLTGHLAIT